MYLEKEISVRMDERAPLIHETCSAVYNYPALFFSQGLCPTFDTSNLKTIFLDDYFKKVSSLELSSVDFIMSLLRTITRYLPSRMETVKIG